jgi:hypothetical protein
MTILVAAVARAEVVWEETFESYKPGERAGWDHRNTIEAKSSAAVSGESASPFAGGLQSYRFERDPDDPKGCWITRSFPATKPPVNIRFDFMATSDHAAQVDIQMPGASRWETVFSLALARGGSLAVIEQGRRSQRLMPVKPRAWYRCELKIADDKAALTVTEHVAGKDPVTKEFKDLALLTGAAGGIDRLTIRGADATFFDNFRVETAP